MPSLAFLPAGLALVLLVLHARALRGGRRAAEFFALAFLYFVVKENLSVAGYFHVYFYAKQPPLRIVDAPLGVVVGWLFTSYVAWTLAERLLARFPKSRGGFPHTVLVAMLVTMTISYPMEAVGTTLGWWRWTVDRVPWVIPQPGDGTHPWVAIPPVPLVGWALFVGGFLFWWLAARAWAPRHAVLRVPIVAAGAALHFQAIHGVGDGPDLLFAILLGVFFLALALSAPPAPGSLDPEGREAVLAAQPWPVREAVDLAVALMVVVVIGFIALEIRDAEHLLTLVPLVLFWVASSVRGLPRATLAIGWALCFGVGVVTVSPKIFTLGFFAMAFFASLGARRVGGWTRRIVNGVPGGEPLAQGDGARAPHP